MVTTWFVEPYILPAGVWGRPSDESFGGMASEEDMRVRNKDEGGAAIDEEPIEDQGGESDEGDDEDGEEAVS